MSKEKVEGSPLTRRKMVIGATQPEEREQPRPQPEHTDIQTSKHKNAKAVKSGSVEKIRTTIYIPAALEVKLKVYIAHHRGEDASRIITRLLEEFLDGEEE